MSMPPALGQRPRILILDSMPGSLSLRRGEYYANAQNRFWRVMANVAGVSSNAAYEDRLAQLFSAGIALWDTLKHCSRIGSLDSGIAARTEVANDLRGLLAETPTIRRIVFNGRKAAGSFRCLVEPGLNAGRAVATITAPSTSAANARADLATLTNAWSQALQLEPE